MWRKRKACALLVGIYIDEFTVENIMKLPYNSAIWKDICTPMFTAVVYNSQDMEVTWVSTHRWMDKECMMGIHTHTHTHTHTLCLYSIVSDFFWHHGPLGSSVLGITQARMLEWFAISSSRGSFWPRDQAQISHISCIGRQILYHWATW